MRKTFVSEAIQPVAGFDSARMAHGEPGLPVKFRWRKKEYAVAGVLEAWKEHGDCRNGSGERYVRKHWYEVRTDADSTLTIYFERRARSRTELTRRWWLYAEQTE